MSSIVAFSSVIAADVGLGSKAVDQCQRRNAASLPLPLPISTHTYPRACHPSDQSPIASTSPVVLWIRSIRPRSGIMHPLNSLSRPTRPLYHLHVLCRLTNRKRMPMVQLMSLQCRVSPSRMTGSSLGIPEHVSLMSERQTISCAHSLFLPCS